MPEEAIQFPSGELQLEGVLHLPLGEGPFPGVVVCHPHSLYGGSMSNNVVLALCRALTENSIVALRFNFRGVGRSTGSFADGLGEQEDVEAAITYVSTLAQVSSDQIGLAGYSFGAAVSLPVALREDRAL